MSLEHRNHRGEKPQSVSPLKGKPPAVIFFDAMIGAAKASSKTDDLRKGQQHYADALTYGVAVRKAPIEQVADVKRRLELMAMKDLSRRQIDPEGIQIAEEIFPLADFLIDSKQAPDLLFKI